MVKKILKAVFLWSAITWIAYGISESFYNYGKRDQLIREGKKKEAKKYTMRFVWLDTIDNFKRGIKMLGGGS